MPNSTLTYLNISFNISRVCDCANVIVTLNDSRAVDLLKSRATFYPALNSSQRINECAIMFHSPAGVHSADEILLALAELPLRKAEQCGLDQ